MLKQFLLLLAAMVGCAGCAMNQPDELGPTPLPQAHAHNDYLHSHPLKTALANGFCSVEADVFAVDGKLLVAHDRDKVTSRRTLDRLYLEPLRSEAARHGGRVYHDGPSITLLIDFKNDWHEILPLLRRMLRRYEDLLTMYDDQGRHEGAVTVILSGHRPPAEVLALEKVRYAAIDGTQSDIDRDDPPDLIPWISLEWKKVLAWRGDGVMPADQQAKLKKLVDRVHAKGRKLRLWGAPDNPAVWQALLGAGVDIINTDNLPGLRAFLLSR